MRVLFINRDTANTVFGGDTLQMNCTAQSLRKLGVQVDINLEFDSIDYSKYDIIHFFNITRPDNILYHISKTNKPFVVSSILMDYSFYKKINTRYRIFAYLFGTDGIEYIKSVFKYVLGKEKIRSKEYLFKGQKASIKKVLKRAHCILPNSENEYRRLLQRYQIHAPYNVIPNGVDLNWKTDETYEVVENAILCVARIEPLKNQLNLIKAINNSEFTLTIVGNPSPNHMYYYQQCKDEANDNIKFIKHSNRNDLLKIFAQSKVHVLSSWFETTGLSSLEAAYCGCNIVVSDRGDVYDYFDGMADFCVPDDPKSILEAIRKAYKREKNNVLRDKIIDEFNWDNAAKKTMEVYKKVLNNIG